MASQPENPSTLQSATNSVKSDINPDIQCFGDKACSQKASISKEMKVKSKSKFLCKECGSLFQNAFNLKKHVDNVHFKIKAYSCDQCEYKNAKKNNVTRHIASVHKKEKPYECSICQSKFKRLDNLVKHVKKYHKDSVVS